MNGTSANVTAVEKPAQAEMLGLVVLKSNEVLNRENIEKEQGGKVPEVYISPIVSYLNGKISSAKQAKQTIELELLASLRQREGSYDGETKALIDRQGGTDIYDNVTEFKCAAAEAWITEILVFRHQDEWPFGLSPTPIPSLPPQITGLITQHIMQRVMSVFKMTGAVPNAYLIFEESNRISKMVSAMVKKDAELRAERMETVIKDQLSEGSWTDAFDEFMYDFITFKTGIIKGPIVTRDVTLNWAKDEKGNTTPVAGVDLKYQFKNISPFDFYPAAGIKNPNDGFIAESQRIPPWELEKMKGSPGYFDEAITSILSLQSSMGTAQMSAVASERYRLEFKGSTTDMIPGDMINAWEVWDTILGEKLNSLGHGSKYEDEKFYHVVINIAGNIPYRCVVNPDVTGSKPYYTASYRRNPHSIWGRGVPELMKSEQKTINSASRAKVNNMGISSMPMQDINIDALADGEIISSQIVPGRVYQTTNANTTGRPAVSMFYPPSRVAEYEDIRQREKEKCDDTTGIPPYTYGNADIGGAGKTFRGLSMLMNSASKGIKRAIYNIDIGIMRRLVKKLWMMNMIYHPDPRIKGDVNIVPKGALELFLKEQDVVNKLNTLQSTNNPIDMQIIGMVGRAKLLREAFKAQHQDPDGIVPDDLEMAEKQIIAIKEAQATQQRVPMETEQVVAAQEQTPGETQAGG